MSSYSVGFAMTRRCLRSSLNRNVFVIVQTMYYQMDCLGIYWKAAAAGDFPDVLLLAVIYNQRQLAVAVPRECWRYGNGQ